MYRQVQCLYCPSGCRHRLRSRPCTHGPGAAASLQVSARTRAPFSRAPGLGDTGGMCALSLPHGCPPTALAGWEPTQPEGTCSATLSGNKPAAAERPRGPARGTARPAGTVGTWGAKPRLGNRGRPDGVGGERGQGPGGNLQLPCSGTCGPGASARWHVHRRQRTRCCGGPVPGGAGIGRRGRGRAGHPTQPRKRHEQVGRGRDGTGLCADTVTSLLLPACPPGPRPTEGSPPGPHSPRWGCQGLCSGEYRHFTLNIKRRIAFVTYRSQRGVSVDSKRGKGARGRGGGGWRGGQGAVSTLLSLRGRCPGAGTRRPRCSSRRGLKT